MKGYLLGVDIGTYESKGVIVNLEGDVISTDVCPHTMSIPRQGWAEHDADAVWWGDFCTIVKNLLRKTGIAPNEILSVGCSAIGSDCLPVDAQGNPLRPGILYGVDTRSMIEIEELTNSIGEESLYHSCANTLSTQSVGPKILWLKKNEPDIYRKAAKFVTATTFLVAKLTGEYYIDHLTAAWFAPMYDFYNNCWKQELSKDVVDIDRLPDLAWSDDLAGKITAEAAQQCGLAEGTPVVVGTVDAASEAVSVGAVNPGQMMLMYGSTVFMIEVLDKPASDKRLWANPFCFKGTSSLMAGMATSGSLTRWFRDVCGADLVANELSSGENAYEKLVSEAQRTPPGSEGLVVLPYFSGERTPIQDPRARGVFFGLTLAHTRGHLFRAVLEGIGYGIKHHFEVMDAIDAAPMEIVAVGGGTKNSLWLQVVSDISGVPQIVPSVTMGASYGDAFLAGLGVGIFSHFTDIKKWMRDMRTITPDLTKMALYEKYYQIYLDLYQRNKDLMHDLQDLASNR